MVIVANHVAAEVLEGEEVVVAVAAVPAVEVVAVVVVEAVEEEAVAVGCQKVLLNKVIKKKLVWSDINKEVELQILYDESD